MYDGRVYETLDLEASGVVQTDIHLDQDQEELYILTSEEVSPFGFRMESHS